MNTAPESLRPFLTGLAELGESAARGIPALGVALTGVFVAKLGLEGHWPWSVVMVLGLLSIGQAARWRGGRMLPKEPVKAVRYLEFWVLAPAALAAAAAALVIAAGVILTVGEPGQAGADPAQTRTLLSATATGITAFLTTGFISWAADEPDSKVANLIRSAFWAHYKRDDPTAEEDPRVWFFPRESAGERWVYSEQFRGIEGWGRAARRARAKGIKEELNKSADMRAQAERTSVSSAPSSPGSSGGSY